jgi:dsDNA-specific endonuclease/ATPase MutS2
MYERERAGRDQLQVLSLMKKTLQPTYRLIVGVAGASSGLEIARRFGVPAKIKLKARLKQ